MRTFVLTKSYYCCYMRTFVLTKPYHIIVIINTIPTILSIQIKNITVHTITKKRNRIGIPLSFLQVTTGNKRQHFFTKDEFLSRSIDGFSRIGNHSVSASHRTSRLHLQERPRSRIYKGYWYMLSHSAISSSGGRPLDGRCYRRM